MKEQNRRNSIENPNANENSVVNIKKREKGIIKDYEENEPLTKTETNSVEHKKSFISSIGNVFRFITVEPSMVLFILACMFSMQTTQNINLDKACRVNLNFTDEICSGLRNQNMHAQNIYEKETQKLVSSYVAMKTYLTATIPSLLALFVGSWSDMTGYRKIFIIIPILGQLLACVNSTIYVIFFNEYSLEVFMLIEAIIESITGNWCIVFLTIFCYISAITTVENRTFRMGLVNFCVTVSFPIGTGLSGILLKTIGYYGCYSISGGLHLLNLLYNIFLLKDPERTAEHMKHDRRGFRYFLRTFFDLSSIKETMRVVFQNGPNKRRIRVCALLIVVSILFGPMFGEISIMYMSTRYRFSWDEVKFSIFQTYNFVTHTIGTLFSITVFSKQLKWHDSILGIISTVSKIAGSFVYCFAPNEKIFYIAPLVEILNGTSLLALRSIISKTVAPNELGKVNSVFGLTENIMPLVYVPLYTKVYTATMEVLPGAVFLMSAALTLPAVCVFSWLLYEHRKGVRKSKKETEYTPVSVLQKL
ncbi:lysosomal proton-coupled steroid conjugate and bile acid symporter SLC46A3-like [Achroia grisella]|uniref:lysosomal proton-coupled steroid conjugate and bile acid symporter SLC46A3-like n=1 Tax=Achroia grisella TaxID=688607 RepID=UPI0027D2AA8B|nr:lysosomal proton-coupled steroid conjugate and bile acid symporter SLC46A3-like [Achroia grisella]